MPAHIYRQIFDANTFKDGATDTMTRIDESISEILRNGAPSARLRITMSPKSADRISLLLRFKLLAPHEKPISLFGVPVDLDAGFPYGGVLFSVSAPNLRPARSCPTCAHCEDMGIDEVALVCHKGQIADMGMVCDWWEEMR